MPKIKRVALAGVALLTCYIMALNLFQFADSNQGSTEPELSFANKLAKTPSGSDIFVVNGTFGNGSGVKKLIKLMQEHETPFYKLRSSNAGESCGLVSNEDIVIIKVNSQ